MSSYSIGNAERLRQYEIETGIDSRSLSFDEYSSLEKYKPRDVNYSVETGTGKSTVIFSNFSKCHYVFTLDDTASPHGSVNYVFQNPLFQRQNCVYVFGPTQKTLPLHSNNFVWRFDYIFLDGPHTLPLVHLEYYYLADHLRAGGVLAMDDLTIPNIRELFLNVAEDDAFEFIDIVGDKLGFPRRTTHPLGEYINQDRWPDQRHNVIGYSASPGHAKRRVLQNLSFPVTGIVFGSSGNAEQFQYHGWSYPEAFGTWSDGTECSLSFTLASNIEELILELTYISPATVEVWFDGQPVGAVSPATQTSIATITIRAVSPARSTHILTLRPTQTHTETVEHFLKERRLGVFVHKVAMK